MQVSEGGTQRAKQLSRRTTGSDDSWKRSRCCSVRVCVCLAQREGSCDAKKRAVTNAYRQLFASLALVILHNGKVAVQILP